MIRHAISPDGRQLAFGIWGAEAGPTVLHFHGGGTCRLEGGLGDDVARASGVRILAYDRPGYGRSESHPGRTFSDAVGDALAVADAAGVDRFLVTGYSAGAPHALALALGAVDRVTGAVLINSAGEAADPAWAALPLTRRWLIHAMTRPAVYSRVFRALRRRIARSSDPGAVRASALFEEGARQGDAAVMEEVALCYDRPWGLDWSALVRPLLILQGEADPNLPYVQAVAARETGVVLETIPGGHMDGGTPAVWQRVCDEAIRVEEGG